jgi:hypothetical protein
MKITSNLVVTVSTTATIVIIALLSQCSNGFMVPSTPRQTIRSNSQRIIMAQHADNSTPCWKNDLASTTLASMIALSTLFYNPDISRAALDLPYSDDSTDTVNNVVRQLKESTGDIDASFKAFENINDIITEGKGVGGSLSYKGVQLERGYVADEDTTIYNPGLSLLTETEKNQIVEAVIQNRKENLSRNTWSEGNELAYENLKMRLDPLHMVELRGYLGIVPIYGAAVYLAVLGVQQTKREWFSVAYIVGAIAVFLPALGLILAGP